MGHEPTENDAQQPGKGDCRFTFAALCALKLLAQLGDANTENELDLEDAWAIFELKAF